MTVYKLIRKILPYQTIEIVNENGSIIYKCNANEVPVKSAILEREVKNIFVDNECILIIDI